jgi:hypothetical protein
MAILDKETSNYYKIEFDECMIRCLSVYAVYSLYREPSDRLKEKERRPRITEFLNAVQQRIAQLNEELTAAVTELGLTPEDIVDADGYVKEEYPDLRVKQKELLALTPMPQRVFERCYMYGDQAHADIEYSASKEALTSYGYDETWVADPIRLTGKASVYCGEYNGEDITQEFYYSRLKTVMNDNIEDC